MFREAEGEKGSRWEKFLGAEESNPNVLSLGTVGCPRTLMDTSTAALWVCGCSVVPQPVCPSQVKQTQSIPGGNEPTPAGLSLACVSKTQENRCTLKE